jgi:DNA-binding NtrC family response regulator
VQQFCLAAVAVLEDPSNAAPLSLAEAERRAIERALAACGSNKTQAARILGITPKTLNAKLSLYNKE